MSVCPTKDVCFCSLACCSDGAKGNGLTNETIDYVMRMTWRTRREKRVIKT